MINQIFVNPPKLILPEQNDSRIQEAQNELLDIGFNIVDIKTFSEFDLYKEHLKTKKFTYNWTDDMLEDYIQNPLAKALILLDLGDLVILMWLEFFCSCLLDVPHPILKKKGRN